MGQIVVDWEDMEIELDRAAQADGGRDPTEINFKWMRKASLLYFGQK